MSTYDPARTVVVATGNAHKLSEIEAILGASPAMDGMAFVALGELGDFADPEENGQTFFDNALIKARAALDETGFAMAVADDSGLVVDALDGAPGIYSARYGLKEGLKLNDAEKNAYLLKNIVNRQRLIINIHCPLDYPFSKTHVYSRVIDNTVGKQ